MNHVVTAPEGPPRAALVLAHGAGAGMRHPFLEQLARELAGRDVATFRYEFPYMESGRKRTDPPSVAAARVREAALEAGALWPGLPLFAGGKSFGGRMTSTAQGEAPLPGVSGLVFFAFPLHPPARPGSERAAHLDLVRVPMLFVQGTRDEFAQPDLLAQVLARLGGRASLHSLPDGDHSFRIRGRSASEVIAEAADTTVRWMAAFW